MPLRVFRAGLETERLSAAALPRAALRWLHTLCTDRAATGSASARPRRIWCGICAATGCAALRCAFLQGDTEKRLGLPVSPMCDRETTQLAQSQVRLWRAVLA